ncbi:hypothetical protein Tco_0151028 [Tanacetum coccineum]
MPNHDTGRILLAESQRNTTDPSVAITDSLATDYDSADESSVCSTPLPLSDDVGWHGYTVSSLMDTAYWSSE